MAAKKKKTDSSDDSDTPEKELTEEILPEGGLVDELVEESGTSDEAPEEQTELDKKLIDSVLSSYLGDEMLEQLKIHADIKDFETIDNANNALVFGGSTRNPRSIRSILLFLESELSGNQATGKTLCPQNSHWTFPRDLFT